MDIKYLLVEDEKKFQDQLAEELRMSAWSIKVICVDNGEDAIAEAERNPQIDLVVLDLYLQTEMNGMEVLKWFSENSDIPVAILSTDDSPERKIQAFNFGAIAYLDKFKLSSSSGAQRANTSHAHRFNVVQIRRYLEGYLSRRTKSKSKVVCYYFNGWNLEPDRRHLIDPEGGTVKLSSMEFDLLLKFVENPQMVLSQEYLIAELCLMETSKAPKKSLTQQISRLRRKLKSKTKGGDKSELIMNSYGSGFYFSPDVETKTS